MSCLCTLSKIIVTYDFKNEREGGKERQFLQIEGYKQNMGRYRVCFRIQGMQGERGEATGRDSLEPCCRAQPLQSRRENSECPKGSFLRDS